jgi:hypothetical protein
MSDETIGIDPYDAVLADLYAKRDQIDQAIAAVESVRTGTAHLAANVSIRASATVANGDINGPGALLGLSIAEATKKLLAAKRVPLKNPDIATLFKAGGLVLNSKDWVNTIGAVLTRRAETIGDIVKVERGTWGLKEWYPGRSFKKEKEGKGAADVEEKAAATIRESLQEEGDKPTGLGAKYLLKKKIAASGSE